ncbi:hypothetical protein Ctob_001914 [Chrysochromulina tobinii]|uniref:Uncharacterized protein n=1 Tax=Chrysochromulina tobinii TaxID=1460289 RepID=A0A0M0JCS6_9EUKA|nr:hypothetical protein Ctob_001914 [Chrysochromulina tobinii]|eukprot:KOO24003.1 hypothetical protein Ctob_001914 [Chrysochromulina sp. CCMP291]
MVAAVVTLAMMLASPPMRRASRDSPQASPEEASVAPWREDEDFRLAAAASRATEADEDARPSLAELEARLKAERRKSKLALRASIGRPRGSKQFETEEALAIRRELLTHPDILSVLELLWFCANTDDSDAIIDKAEYTVMHRKITLTLEASNVTPREEHMMVEIDWERDSEGKPGLDRDRFYWTWFELADMYTPSLEAEAYVNFLGNMLQYVVRMDAEGTPSWKLDREIIEMYFERKRAKGKDFGMDTTLPMREAEAEAEADEDMVEVLAPDGGAERKQYEHYKPPTDARAGPPIPTSFDGGSKTSGPRFSASTMPRFAPPPAAATQTPGPGAYLSQGTLVIRPGSPVESHTAAYAAVSMQFSEPRVGRATGGRYPWFSTRAAQRANGKMPHW